MNNDKFKAVIRAAVRDIVAEECDDPRVLLRQFLTLGMQTFAAAAAEAKHGDMLKEWHIGRFAFEALAAAENRAGTPGEALDNQLHRLQHQRPGPASPFMAIVQTAR